MRDRRLLFSAFPGKKKKIKKLVIPSFTLGGGAVAVKAKSHTGSVRCNVVPGVCQQCQLSAMPVSGGQQSPERHSHVAWGESKRGVTHVSQPTDI